MSLHLVSRAALALRLSTGASRSAPAFGIVAGLPHVQRPSKRTSSALRKSKRCMAALMGVLACLESAFALNWVSGTIRNEDGAPLACMSMLVIDIDVSDATVFTDRQGRYVFGLPSGASRALLPLSPGGYTAVGITPADSLLVINFLNSGNWTGSRLQRVAADVSDDGLITSLDALQLNHFINGNGNPARSAAWIFVPASYQIPEATGNNVPPIIQSLWLPTVNQDLPQTDFLAVMAGDLNNSAATQFCNACGNGLPNPGEACDDGNNNPGDGCSPGCAVECGNGVIDPAETCDDGNTLDGDGCSATCQVVVLPLFENGFEAPIP